MVGRGEETESAGPNPRILGPQWPCVSGVVSPKGASPSGLAQGISDGKTRLLMDCTAVSPEDTRGQEALTQKTQA